MAMYLLVAYQTAQRPQLLAATQELSRVGSRASSCSWCRQTPVGNMLIKEGSDSAGIARRRAVSARAWLQDAGVRMADAKVAMRIPCRRSATRWRAVNPTRGS
jgi:hypothetical protein